MTSACLLTSVPLLFDQLPVLLNQTHDLAQLVLRKALVHGNPDDRSHPEFRLRLIADDMDIVPTEAAVSRRLKSVVLLLRGSASRRLHKDILGLDLNR